MQSSEPLFSQYKEDQGVSGGRHKLLLRDPDNIDIGLFRMINNKRSDFLDKGLTIIDNSVFPAALLLPSALIIYGRGENKPYEENTGVLLASSEITNFALTFGIKNIIKRKRPYITLSNVNHKNVSIKDEYSFPSNHTSTSFSIASTFALRYSKYPQIYVPMYVWGLIVGYGRVYWGMHYPSDVLGGAVLGTLSAAAIYSLRVEIIKAKNNLLGEKNKPDINNNNSKSIGIITASCLLSLILNEFTISRIGNINLQFQPAASDGSIGIGCRINCNPL